MNKLFIKKKNELNQKKKKGFTLVELIVVIAVIAILAAIAIPKFGQVRESANSKADLATAKNIATIVSQQLADGEISTTTTKSKITEIPSAAKQDEKIDITSQLDGMTKPKGGTDFYVQVENGNVKVFIDEDTNPIYPQSNN